MLGFLSVRPKVCEKGLPTVLLTTVGALGAQLLSNIPVKGFGTTEMTRCVASLPRTLEWENSVSGT